MPLTSDDPVDSENRPACSSFDNLGLPDPSDESRLIEDSDPNDNHGFRKKTIFIIAGSISLTLLITVLVVSMVSKYIEQQQQKPLPIDKIVISTKMTTSSTKITSFFTTINELEVSSKQSRVTLCL
jgi:hypothetical protein